MGTVKVTLTSVLCAAALAAPAVAATYKLLPSDGAAYDSFGRSVSVSGDTAVVGTCWDDDNGMASGSAYVYVSNGSTWSEQAKLTASDGAAEDYFGNSVSVSGDTAVVGARLDDDNGTASGSVYVFVRSGSTWTEQAKLTASDGAAEDYFGMSVSVDGDTAFVGAILGDEDGIASGSVYVFVRSGTTWTEQTKLTASDGAADDYFGVSVSVNDDTAVVGAFRDDENGVESGSAYVFVRSGGVWTQQAKLTASDGAARDSFGISVSLDGDTAFVGAEFGNDVTDSGSAYVFVRSGSTWIQQAKLTASDSTIRDHFGGSVSVNGDTALVGARYDNDNGTQSGSAYVFDLDMIVTAPTGGGSWDAGSSQAVTWASRGVTDVKIEFSRDGGATWEEIVASTSASAGSYPWTVTGPASADCLIRVSDELDGSPADDTDATFTIREQITVALSQSAATEGDGTLSSIGTVDIPTALATPLTVALASDDTTEATVPTEVVIPAGLTSVNFDVTIVNDAVIDGDKTATITASAAAYVSDGDPLLVLDNEPRTLAVTLPASATEGDGTLAGQGSITSPSVCESAQVVALASSDETELMVPATVTILQGETSATFDLFILDDGAYDGTHTVSVTASAAGWTPGSAEMDVINREVIMPFGGGCTPGPGSPLALVLAFGAMLAAMRRGRCPQRRALA